MNNPDGFRILWVLAVCAWGLLLLLPLDANKLEHSAFVRFWIMLRWAGFIVQAFAAWQWMNRPVFIIVQVLALFLTFFLQQLLLEKHDELADEGAEE